MNDTFKDLVNEFKCFHEKNPEVYKNLSSEMIVNRIRWETDVMTTDKDYKINNDYKPFYSRLFMAEHKQYENFFRKRGSHADNIDWSSYVVQESHSAAKVS